MNILAQHQTFEQTTIVAFNGASLVTAKIKEVIYVAMRPIVEAMGLDWAGQTVKLNHNKEKFNCCDIATVAEDGKNRSMLFIPLRKLNGWLFSINPSKVREDLRERVVQYQEECFDVLYRYWQGEVVQRQPTLDPNDFITQTLSQISKGNRKLYMSMYNGLIRHFGVGRIGDIPASDCAKAIEVMRVYANEWEYKNGSRPAQKLNDGYNFFVVKDGVPIYQKVINGDSSNITPAMLNNQPILLEHIKQVIGEFVGKAALPAPKNHGSPFEAMQSMTILQGDVDYRQVRDCLAGLIGTIGQHQPYEQVRPTLIALETVDQMLTRLWTMIDESSFRVSILQAVFKTGKPLNQHNMDTLSNISNILSRKMMTLQMPNYHAA